MKTRHKSWFSLVVLLPALVCSIDTGRAQSNSLTATPSQLTLTGASDSKTLLITSSGGQVNVTISTISNSNWLRASSASGVTPLTVFVSSGSTAPATGSDAGYINVSAAGANLSVLVQFNASSSGAPSPLSTSPTSLSFNFAANSNIPMTLPVTVSSSNTSINSFTATRVTSDGGNWLSVPTSGSLAIPLQVTVNPSALQGAGPFSAAIAINAPGSNGVILPVLVTVPSTPAITVSPAQLSFAYQTGTTQPFAQLSIGSSSGATLSFTASAVTSSCGNNWLVLSPQSGATPSTLSVQVNTSGLSPGMCAGEIDIAAPGASNSPVKVGVKLLVSNNPLLQVPSSGPTFTYQLGTGAVPAAQNVQISSSTPGLNFNASAAAPTGSPNFLQLSPTSGVTPLAVALSVNPQVLANLGPATYTETVTISSTGADNSPQSFPVTLIVNSNPLLTANVPSLNFNYQIGQTAPSPQTITVNSTGAPLNYQAAVSATTCPGFLSTSLSSGFTFSPPPQTQNQVVVSVNTASLTAQVCSGNVTLTVPGSTAPPLVIPVTLDVANTPLLNVGQAAISVTTLVGAGSSAQVVSVSSTDPNTQLPFTAVAATNPVGLTWLSVVPNSGNTPNNLQITINPANLQPGTYTGSINVSSTVQNVPAQTTPVTLVVASSIVTPSPSSLAFAQSVAGSVPPVQMVQISGVPAGTTIGAVATMLNGSAWLTTSVSGTSVTVNANGSQLPIGSYQGVVTVIVPGAGNSPLNIPVTLSVSATPTLSVSPTTVGFNYTSGSSAFPPSQTVAVTSTGSIPFTASFAPGQSVANPGNFIVVTPASGTTTATLTLAADPTILARLSPGTYTGTVTVSSPGVTSQTVNVTLTVLPAPPPVLVTITNAAASLQAGPIAPGELVSIFGTGLGPLTGVSFALTAANTVPTTLGGVTVKFNNVLAPLLFVRADQINAIVPYEIAGQPIANIVVQFGGSTSAALQANVVGTQPAIFSASQGGNGQGAILNQDYSANNAGNPAVKGTVIQIFGTGEGQLLPAVPTGSVTPGVPPYSKPIATPITVTIGGQPADIQYAGEAPTLVAGVLQVNAVVPANIPSGNQQVVLTMGTNSNTTQIITVAVQ